MHPHKVLDEISLLSSSSNQYSTIQYRSALYQILFSSSSSQANTVWYNAVGLMLYTESFSSWTLLLQVMRWAQVIIGHRINSFQSPILNWLTLRKERTRNKSYCTKYFRLRSCVYIPYCRCNSVINIICTDILCWIQCIWGSKYSVHK